MADRGNKKCYSIADIIATNVSLVIHKKSGMSEIMKTKFIDDMTKALEAQQEAEMMQSCSHRYIAQILDCFLDADKLSIIMKYYNDGDLEKLIARLKKAGQPLTEVEVLTYFL